MSTPSKALFKKRVSLKPFNTFGIDAIADHWIEIFHPDDIARLMESDLYRQYPHYILGGGSNVLFPVDYHGLIIKNSIPGIAVISEDRHHVIIRTGAGVVWDDLVRHCLENGWGGLENLSMIPGLTGAAPIQNIGAYGVELEETFVSADAVNMDSGRMESFDREMCRFGYRDSIFKRKYKGRYIITGVTLKLDKNPQVNISYGALKAMLDEEGVTRPTIHDVSRAVRAVRSSKLPDPSVTGNAGSFFKNPVISAGQFASLQEVHPEIPGFPAGNVSGASNEKAITSDDVKDPTDVKSPADGKGSAGVKRPAVVKGPVDVKIPAAWLIEKCEFKGMREGDAGVHERHALILVNHGRATGKQLLGIARKIKEAVLEKFDITLEPEVNIVNGDIGTGS